EQISFFGGDYDNFTYPRYDLDITFLRAYENGKPANTPNYFRFSETGAVDGEFIVVPGNPGSTARLLTVAQLAYQRDVGNPLLETTWKTRLNALETYAKQGDEQLRQAHSGIRSLRNSLKRLAGQEEGLLNSRQSSGRRSRRKKIFAISSRQSPILITNTLPHGATLRRHIQRCPRRLLSSRSRPFRLQDLVLSHRRSSDIRKRLRSRMTSVMTNIAITVWTR
ncbi:MAG: hypothetical protein DYH05_12385, partial [Acidobacteria bacterium ACB1]|nr:hypothetical protein [Acidobacteria bacterium ACB1]